MLKKLFCGFVLALIFSAQAQAWTAVAFDQASGKAYTTFNDASREDAKHDALEACKTGFQFAACELIGGVVRATATVIAKSDADPRHIVIGVASNPNPYLAAKIAMASCSKTAKNCYLDSAAWDQGNNWAGMILDHETGFYFFLYNYLSKGELLRAGSDTCAKNDHGSKTCQFQDGTISNQKAWYVLVKQGDEAGFGASSGSKADAIQDAIHGLHVDASNQHAPRQVVDAIVNRGPVPEPVGVKVLQEKILRMRADRAKHVRTVAAVAQPQHDCRPTGGNLTCTSSCVNGSCIVKYANGCKMHVEVQPTFDAFNNQWTYPSPGC